MEITRFKVCDSTSCEIYDEIALAIEEVLELEKVKIDQETGELSFDNPENCRVDERELKDAVRKLGRNVEFKVCE